MKKAVGMTALINGEGEGTLRVSTRGDWLEMPHLPALNARKGKVQCPGLVYARAICFGWTVSSMISSMWWTTPGRALATSAESSRP